MSDRWSEQCDRCGHTTSDEIGTNGRRWRCLSTSACKARKRDADVAALREAVREGVREGLAPLQNLVAQVEKTLKAAQQTAAKLKQRGGRR